MARYRNNYNRSYTRETSQSVASVQILKSFGTTNSKGATPGGQTCEGEGTEIEFSLNIYQTDTY